MLKPHAEGLEAYDLPPQGIAVIVSKERLKVPDNMLGHALPKSALCEQGLLLLNTGLIDPCFDKELVGVVLNFSKVPIALRRGDRFIRLVFTQIDFPIKCEQETRRSFEDRGKIVKNYPFFFLNLNENARRIAKEAVNDAFPKWALFIGFITFLAALATIIIAPIVIWSDAHGVEERVRQIELKAATQVKPNPPGGKH